MKANQHEHCLIILIFRRTWLILHPFLSSFCCQTVSQGAPCLLLWWLCQSCCAGMQTGALYLSPPADPAFGLLWEILRASLSSLEGRGISGVLLISNLHPHSVDRVSHCL